MKKYFALLLILAPALYAQTPTETGSELTAGKTATLGVEATTAFAWDIENESTGLESKAGIELVFPLFSAADRGIYPEDEPETPAVRLALRNASFLWWNTYYANGGNYEQDDFNKWQVKPLVLTFDTFLADLVWKNYFFRVAGTTTVMRANSISLRSIFDDVMDVNDRDSGRYYYKQNQALWRTERYNIENFPLLKNRLERDYVDADYRDKVSGSLAAGAEFEMFSLTLKTASRFKGRDNDENAWLFGADFEVVPVERLKLEGTVFASANYDKAGSENLVSFGTMLQYQLPLTDDLILEPFLGFDFAQYTDREENEWELGAGVVFYTRGDETLTSSRLLDWDDVIPVGASVAMNINENSRMNLVLSWFDPAGPQSLLPNFGGFLQFELANLLDKEDDEFGEGMDYAVLAHLEYSINEKVTPYIRGGYRPDIPDGIKRNGDFLITTALGCYLTPVHFFSVDIRYEMNNRQTKAGDMEIDKGLFRTVFTIRM